MWLKRLGLGVRESRQLENTASRADLAPNRRQHDWLTVPRGPQSKEYFLIPASHNTKTLQYMGGT